MLVPAINSVIKMIMALEAVASGQRSKRTAETNLEIRARDGAGVHPIEGPKFVSAGKRQPPSQIRTEISKVCLIHCASSVVCTVRKS
jgi:hypothetical protein